MSKPLPTGIYGIVGAPGSGKSYKAVREIAYCACTEHRPIYTNIPIVPKRLRAYIYRKLPKKIRGHAARRARANLVQSISKRHFEAFCTRLGGIDKLAERIMDERGVDKDAIGQLAEFQQTACRNEAMRRYAEAHGEPCIIGRHADWVPPGSVLFLDELHKWYPSREYKSEPQAILDFTSMHRHMQLKVFVLTQRWMNVSLSFRSMTKEVWFCMNYSKRPVLGFFRLDRWVNVFRYVHFLGEDIEEKTGLPRLGARPVWSELVWPEWNGGVEYGLYRSYSHAGTLEQQRAEIEAVTRAMTGAKEPEQPQQTESDDMPKKQTMAGRVSKGFTWCSVLALAFMVGRCSSPRKDSTIDRDELAAMLAAAKPTEQPAQATGQPADGPTAQQLTAPPAEPAWAGKRLGSVAQNWVMIDGQRYTTGDRLGDLLLVGVDPAAGDSAWIAKDGRTYRWTVGRECRPGRLPDSVRAALLRALSARAAAAADPAPAPAASAGVDDPGLRP